MYQSPLTGDTSTGDGPAKHIESEQLMVCRSCCCAVIIMTFVVFSHYFELVSSVSTWRQITPVILVERLCFRLLRKRKIPSCLDTWSRTLLEPPCTPWRMIGAKNGMLINGYHWVFSHTKYVHAPIFRSTFPSISFPKPLDRTASNETGVAAD